MSEATQNIMQRLCQRAGFSALEEGRLKLDLDVGIQKIWPMMMYGSGLLMVLGICAGVDPDVLDSKATWPFVLFLGAAMMLVFAGIARFRTDNNP